MNSTLVFMYMYYCICTCMYLYALLKFESIHAWPAIKHCVSFPGSRSLEPLKPPLLQVSQLPKVHSLCILILLLSSVE